MAENSLILVQGLFYADPSQAKKSADRTREHRAKAVAQYGEALGIRDYEWVDGRAKTIPNRFLRLIRGTAPAVDAAEIFELDAATLHTSLAQESTRESWKKMASCTPFGFDPARSFILMGAPIQLLDGAANGQRVLWFGRGQNHLSEAEFIAHYTGRHGPLVAGYAQPIGLRRYRQVPSQQPELCDELRALGLGQADAPGVFAELVMGTPPLTLKSLRARRAANREIETDEKRHIDFGRSMLLLS